MKGFKFVKKNLQKQLKKDDNNSKFGCDGVRTMPKHIVSVFSECNFSEKGVKRAIESVVPAADVIYIKPDTRIDSYTMNTGAAKLGRFILKWTEKGLKVEITEIKKKESLQNIKKIVNDILSNNKNDTEVNKKLAKLNNTDKTLLKYTVSGFSPHEMAIKMKLPLYAVYGLRYELLDKLKMDSWNEISLMFGRINLILLK